MANREKKVLYGPKMDTTEEQISTWSKETYLIILRLEKLPRLQKVSLP